MDAIQHITRSARNMRSEMHINPANAPLIISGKHTAHKNDLHALLPFIEHLAKTKPCTFSEDTNLAAAAKAVVDIAAQTGHQLAKSLCVPSRLCQDLAAFSCNVHMPLAGLIDVQDEIHRIEKNVAKIEKQLESF